MSAPPPEEIDQVPAFIRFQMALDTIATAHAAMPLMGRSVVHQPDNCPPPPPPPNT
ncbi:hypothetical protein QKT49_gp353 [Acanthamoeba castellanii medusavirus]|uniref:Uncharacterized protein n=1 Tax=Acanthamoeba castellanii medusavirus J1 TaxID=3114988 RepID=A0A3T1CX50_9VIRU|nr:hypothetical protein QKT49_gp353 [Acanthamoeba castellanii medusavirus]BBI30410.1 hypothetical protein [Acanthamoeba castellanii medusavirus J1]